MPISIWYDGEERHLVERVISSQAPDWGLTCIPEADVSTVASVLDLLRQGYDAILVHLSLPYYLGLKLAEVVRREDRGTKVIAFSGTRADARTISVLFDGHIHPDNDVGRLVESVSEVVSQLRPDRPSVETIEGAIVTILNTDSVLQHAFQRHFGVRHKREFTFDDYQRLVRASFPLDTIESGGNAGIQWDLFMSYASEDSSLASELRVLFAKKGLSCFMASKDIASGRLWEPAIREAISVSKEIVILLTPHSVNKQWVMIEGGAAWVLEKRITPCLAGALIQDVPEPLSKHQARSVVTQADKRRLVNELKERLLPASR